VVDYCRAAKYPFAPIVIRRAVLFELRRATKIFTLLALSACISSMAAENPAAPGFTNVALSRMFQSWNQPFKPLRIVGNIHYVGASGVSSYLITSPEGHVLIDTGFEQTVPLIRDSVEKLGFRMADIKLILASHAHVDHTGGHALAKELTGARIIMSEADAALLASGGKADFLDEVMPYRPAKADQIVRDGEQIKLGPIVLTALLTPGHTKGCTTWTTVAEEGGKRYDVVFFGSTSVLTKLVNNSKYPQIARDYAATFRKLKALPCDVFLAPHASFFGLEEKARRAGHGANPFVDATAFQEFVTKAEQAFVKQLETEQSSNPTGPQQLKSK
jgi:metallo-beta-lactamase class B